jgi:segregation and condensation protein B
MTIKRIVEAILFAANRPMTIKQIIEVFPEIERPDTIEVQDAIDAIIEDYLARPIELKKVASGYRFQVRAELSRWVSRLFEEKPPRYSRALLETLAIIAYRQPVTRGEIEDIRGVGVSSSIIQTLLEREWIKVIGQKEAPGRPSLYGTTRQFLDYFNITTLSDLPTLQEIQDLDLTFDNTQPMLQEESEQQETPGFADPGQEIPANSKQVDETAFV